jgi:Icc-related predicted phosphoesterase
MKIAICSDLHLEFGGIKLQNDENSEVLILGGDICVAADLRSRDPYEIMNTAKTDRFFELMESCSRNFNYIVYIMGNHEHYHGDFAQSADIIRRHLKGYDNIHFLDKESIEIDGVTFIGGTLWTDMNKEDPLTMHSIAGMMNDYRGVKNSSRMVTRKVPVYEKDENGNVVYEEVGPADRAWSRPKEIGMKLREEIGSFSPEDSVEDHKKMLGYIQSVIEGKYDQKFVVVGHHAPSKLSTHPRYKHEAMMNGAYSSDLSEYIMDHPQIKLWTHGHTHEDFDYMLGSTRIVCNPRGYDGYEERADNFNLKVVEI